MKPKPTAPQWVILVLGAGLMISLIANVYLLQQKNAPLPHLRGTYCTDASTGLGTYLIFDGESRFCRYTQTEGVLDDGTCRDLGEGRYALRSEGGRTFCVLQSRDGVEFFDGEELDVSFFPKLKEFGDAYMLFDIPGEYPDWLKAPA
ncbi:MAG: hypothetical protein HFF98_11690 [Oscillibacter sp.]|jgi:hypothetical protein|nr:hypothetical protein [Oscillibacter sp.]